VVVGGKDLGAGREKCKDPRVVQTITVDYFLGDEEGEKWACSVGAQE